MNRSSIFWSIYLILVGVLLALKLFLRLDFSWFSAAVVVLLIEGGVFLLVSGVRHGSGGNDEFGQPYSNGNFHMFMNGSVSPLQGENEITTVFSGVNVILPQQMPPRMEINCIFGHTTVRVPEGWAAKVHASAAFGQVTTPEGNVDGFGERDLIVGSGLECVLVVNTVFGQSSVLLQKN